MASKQNNSVISSNSLKELGCFIIAIIAIVTRVLIHNITPQLWYLRE